MRFSVREFVFVLLLMFLIVGAWWFVFKPRSEANMAAMAQTAEKQRKLQALNSATGRIGDLQHEIQSLEQAIELFRRRLPARKEIDKILRDIWMLAEANKLNTRSIRPLAQLAQGFASADGPHAEQPIALTLEGDFLGFYAFLQALENQPRITRIRKMALLKDTCKGRQGRMKADFEMSIFFERDKKDAS